MSFLFPMRPSVPRTLPATPADYLIQTKYDGWNIVINEGRVWTRRGKDITSWCADWGFELEPKYPVNGELVAEADDTTAHRTDIPGIRSGRCRPLVMAFDLMLEGPPIEERLCMLTALAAGSMTPVTTTNPLRMDACWKDVNILLENAKTDGHEGLVLKRKQSTYFVSREISIITPDWLKLKVLVKSTRRVTGDTE